MSSESFSNFIEKALSVYDCSKIDKFVDDSKGFSLCKLGCKLDTWIHFAVARDVQELILEGNEYGKKYHLPQFLLETASLVKFRAQCCAFMPDGNVRWVSLKALYLDFCKLPNHAIENVLNGCPVIEYLKLFYCHGFEELVVVSESLKMLCIRACPSRAAIEICCPNMEILELLDEMEFSNLKFEGLPPSVSATLDFEIVMSDEAEVDVFEFVKEILLQVQHVKELSLGPWILMILSQGVARGEPCPSLNSKCLTVFDPFLEIAVPGLVFLLLSFPVLEKLKIQLFGGICFRMGGLVKVGKKFWVLNESLFSHLMSSLKTVEIETHSYGRSEKYDKLLQFILRNARVSGKMVLIEEPGQEMDFVNEICHKLSAVRKSSPQAVVEVARLPRGYMRSSLEYEWNNIAY